MKYEDVDKLTADELHKEVAKAQGWYAENGLVSAQNATILYHRDEQVDFDWGHDIPVSEFQKPDYTNPCEYMALYDEILEKKKDAVIGWGGIWWNCNGMGCYLDSFMMTRWEAIARAWLVICGGPNEIS